MSIVLTKIPNPACPDINEKEIIDYVPNQTLAFYVDSRIPDIDPAIKWVVALNGVPVEGPFNEVRIEDGDKIAICPRTGITASAALATWVTTSLTSVAAFSSLGALASYSLAAAALYVGTFVASMFVIGYGMSMLASALGPDTPEDSYSDPTYSWGILQQTENEGVNIPVLYGANKIAGHIINQFITIDEDNDEETLYALMALCDHEVDSIEDIRLNDQPYTYFEDCEVGYRLGTLSDEAMDGFGELVTQNDVNSKVTYSTPRTYQTQGQCEKLKIILSAPYGIYYSNDEGGLSERTITYTIEYREVDATSWTTHVASETWTDSTSSGVKKVETIDSLDMAQYEVKVTRETEDSTSHRERTDFYFSSLQEVVKEDLTYPGLAKYFVKVLATDQISSGVPTMTCLATRSTVQVYNEDTSLWEERSATNPAWICYDLLIRAKVPETRILYYEFEEWADYCDEDVSDAQDGSEKRIEINTIITSGNYWDNIQSIARMGRAAVLRRNASYGVFIDKPADTIHHLFTMGNIVEDSFDIQYLPKKDRASAVEIEYTDPNRDYSRQVVTVYSDDYIDGTLTDQKASVSFSASFSQAQATREGVFRVNSNKHLVRVVTFDAFVDSFACVTGDLFDFQHEVVNFSQANASGHIVDAGNGAGSTEPYVTLDTEVSLESGSTYKIKVRLSDDSLVEKTVDNTQIADFSEPMTTLPLTSAWSTAPDSNCVYAFGEADTYTRTYRITSVTRKNEEIRNIVGLEYIEDIYTENDGYVIEEATWESSVQEATAVFVDEYLAYSADGSYTSNLTVSWYRASSTTAAQWAVWLKDDTAGTVASKLGTTSETAYTITEDLVTGNTYTIYICIDGNGLTDTGSNTASITIQGKLAPPGDVTNFQGSWDAVHRSVTFSWSAVDDIDLYQYEIRDGSDWDTATVLKNTAETTATIYIDEGVAETRIYTIKALDTSGIYSENTDSTSVSIDTSDCDLVTPGGVSVTSESVINSDGTNAVVMIASWNADAEVSDNFSYYEIQVEDQVTSRASTYTTTNQEYQWEVLPNRQYGISVRAVDISGNTTAWSTQVLHTTTTDSVAPDAPTGLSATEFFSKIHLTWSHSGEDDLSYFNIYRNTSNTFSGASVVNTSTTNKTTTSAYGDDTPPDYSTYYYWVTAVDSSGNESDESTSVSAAMNQIGTNDILDGAIDDSLLHDTLSDRIDEIDTPGGILDRLTTAESEMDSVQSDVLSIENELSTTSGAATTSAALSALWTGVDDNAGDITSLSQDVVALETILTDDNGDLTASANAIVDLETSVSEVNGEVEALSSQTTQLSSTVDDNTADIQQNILTMNGVTAQYTVKVDNNGFVSGFGLISSMDPETGVVDSEFTVLADKFIIIDPDYTDPDNPEYAIPFIVGSVDGVSQVGINGELLVDGTIKANAIESASITADKLNVDSLESVSANITGSLIVGTNGAFEMGKEYYTDTAAGIFMGYRSSTGLYVFHIGDSDRYLKFDGSNIEIKGDVTITGGSGYSNLSDTPTLGDVASLDSITGTYISNGAVTSEKINVTTLNALTTNTGALNISGTLTFTDQYGNIEGGKINWSDTAAGIFLGARGSSYPGQYVMNIGDSSEYIKYGNGSLTIGGDIIATGNIKANNVTTIAGASASTNTASVSFTLTDSADIIITAMIRNPSEQASATIKYDGSTVGTFIFPGGNTVTPVVVLSNKSSGNHTVQAYHGGSGGNVAISIMAVYDI